jgi:hypothetical protein
VSWLRWLENQGDAKNASGRVLRSGPHRGDGSLTRWPEVINAAVLIGGEGMQWSWAVREGH